MVGGGGGGGVVGGGGDDGDDRDRGGAPDHLAAPRLNLDGEIGPLTRVTIRGPPDAVDVIIHTHSRAAAYDGPRAGPRRLD